MRYLVADGSIGENGRKVKCASCGHQWFQEPPQEVIEPVVEIAMEDALRPKEKAADIPDSVKPRHEDAKPPVLVDDAKAMRDQDMIAKVCGYFSAFLVFLLLFLMLVIFKGPLTSAFPPSVMLYELLKLSPPVPGTGLVIDQLHAVVAGDTLTVDGQVINLTTKDMAIPPLSVSVLDKDNAILASMPVPLDVDHIGGEVQVAFKVTLPAPDGAGVSLKVGFTLP